METYEQPQEKISLRDRLIMWLNREGPYFLRFLIRLIADFFLLLIKFIKYLWQSFLGVFRGEY